MDAAAFYVSADNAAKGAVADGIEVYPAELTLRVGSGKPKDKFILEQNFDYKKFS